MTTPYQRLYRLIGMVMAESEAIEFLNDDDFDKLLKDITDIVNLNFDLNEK